MENSERDYIPHILDVAIESANRALYAENQQNDGEGLTTLVVAIIYRNRCYIGNVGDSRAYWVQINGKSGKGKILQLTRDHSYYNIYGGDPHGEDASVVVNAYWEKARCPSGPWILFEGK